MTRPRFNPWPGGIVLAFALFIAGTITLVVFSTRHGDHLVRADYYEHELRYQKQMDSLGRAARLGAGAAVGYDAGTRQIRIALPAEHARQQAHGRIQLYRPSEAGLDAHFDLELNAEGVQVLDARTLRPGLWKVRISWSVGGEDFALDERLVIRAGPA